MKLLLAFCLMLVTHSVFAQCISIKEMRAFAKKGLGQREEFMEARGYTYNGTFQDTPDSWQWEKSEHVKFMCIVGSDEARVESAVVINSMGTTASCVQNIKNEIVLLHLRKDDEYYRNEEKGGNGEKSFSRCYSGDTYGICLRKTSWPDGLFVYTIYLYTDMSFYRESLKNRT